MITFKRKDTTEKFYLTHYSEYPIYEPAEGGYYYAGSDYDCYWESDSIDEIRDKFKEMESGLREDGYEIWDFEYNDGYVSGMALFRSKYIGHNDYWVIETKLGSDVKGYEPYC